VRTGARIVALCLSAVTASSAACGALAETLPPDIDQDTQILAAFARPLPDRPIREQAKQLQTNQEQARFLLFANTDLWRQGGFGHGGVLWAPSGLDRDGPVLKLMFGGGIYHYRSGALGDADVRGEELAGAVLPGWRFVRNGFAATVFLGVDFQQHRLTPDDLSAGLRGDYVGARMGFDIWYQPTAATMMAADAAWSTVGPSYNVRVAMGLRVLDAFYLGPEIQAFGADSNYRQFRVGLHITGFRTGVLEWSAGAGLATDSDGGSGAYGKLGVFTRL
jgi:hypothetical protein